MIALEVFWLYRCGLLNLAELSLSDTLGIEAGDMHRMVENANWLSYLFKRDC